MSIPSDKTKMAFDKIKANGDLIFIASGRAKCLLPSSIIDLNPSGYILANGAYCEMDGKILFEDIMPVDIRNKIINFAIDNDCVYYLENKDYIYTKDLSDKLHIEYSSTWDITKCYKDKGYTDNTSINIAMLAMHKDDCLIEKVYEELGQYVDINRQGNFYSFDLNIMNVNKGSAIAKIIEYLDIDKENTYAFGDGINDIEMMQMVNHSIAMANANKLLIAHCKEFTDNVLDDGFYNYLDINNLIS